MAAISEIISWLSTHSVAPVTFARDSRATLKRLKILGVASVTSVTHKKPPQEAACQRPLVWHIEINGKRLTLMDFAHTPESEIEKQLRVRFGRRLSAVEPGKSLE